ncbi:unnamed protein product [Haemonchus placei]|uniref:Secreted protein n=1 Tax=Haemonchus placei TaxID=6290 RepID=A0A0N4X2N2_HAEPC|nr:unnamed protein product [Haemonchus placei]
MVAPKLGLSSHALVTLAPTDGCNCRQRVKLPTGPYLKLKETYITSKPWETYITSKPCGSEASHKPRSKIFRSRNDIRHQRANNSNEKESIQGDCEYEEWPY